MNPRDELMANGRSDRASARGRGLELERQLERRWGFSSFRPGQREVVEAVVSGDPVVAIMPTGAGKSLCYQLPASIGDRTTLVVSPLIALMKDQVESLRARGIAATFINSHVPPEERRDRFRRLRDGAYRLLYLAPERLNHDHTVEFLRRCPIDRVAIDEAHCISQWGHDFRPDYLALGEIAQRLGAPQICAFTATATREVREDIVRALRLERPRVFVHGFRRDNLTLRVVPISSRAHKLAYILSLSRTLRGGSGIVYAATRKSVERVAAELCGHGVAALAYHAGLDEQRRSDAQDRFMGGDVEIIVATNAFGMGVDKPDTRFVVHHDVPGSIEAYYQEAGRAGRDGEPAECAILFTYADVRTQEFFIDKIGEEGTQRGRPITAEEVDRLKTLERAKLGRMVRYCYADTCRHDTLLRYFGERVAPRDGSCGACDRCLQAAGVPDPGWVTDVEAPSGRPRRTARPAPIADRPADPALLTPRALDAEEAVAARKLLSGVARGRGRLSESQLVALLRGDASPTPDALQGVPTFGCLSGWAESEIQALARALAQAGALRWEGERPPRAQLTEAGVEAMKGSRELRLAMPRLTERAADVPADPALFEALRAKRAEQARAKGVAPFLVAHDSLLKRLAAHRPRTRGTLLAIGGVGGARLAEYGGEWLRVIREHEGG